MSCKTIIIVVFLTPATPLFAQIVLDGRQQILEGWNSPPQLHWELLRGEAPSQYVPFGEYPQCQRGAIPCVPSGTWLASQQFGQFGVQLPIDCPKCLNNLPPSYIPPPVRYFPHDLPPRYETTGRGGLFLSPSEKHGRTTRLFNLFRRLWQLRYTNSRSMAC